MYVYFILYFLTVA